MQTEPLCPIRVLLRLAVMLAVSTHQAHAQTGNAHSLAVQHRNDCRLAEQVLRTGQPSAKARWAHEYIADCIEEGPSIIAREWRASPADTGAVLSLVRRSTRLVDERIYVEARSVVLDRSRPGLVRVGAMLVLDNYAYPRHLASLADLRPPGDSVRYVRPAGGTTLNAVRVVGPRALPSDVRADVLSTLERVARSRHTEPRDVWYAAAALAKRIRQ